MFVDIFCFLWKNQPLAGLARVRHRPGRSPGNHVIMMDMNVGALEDLQVFGQHSFELPPKHDCDARCDIICALLAIRPAYKHSRLEMLTPWERRQIAFWKYSYPLHGHIDASFCLEGDLFLVS